MRRLALGALVAAVGASLPACDLEPDVGPARVGRCTQVDSDPTRAVSFVADIRPILTAVCSHCHFPGGENPIGLELGGLDLSSYDTLREGGARSAGVLVLPDAPCDSVLYQKVSPGPPFGSRMPLNGPPFLSDRQIGLIHDWIAEGARDN